MAKFNTGQSFADGDTVTGAKLNNITGLLDIYSGVIADQTSIAATVSTADLLLIADTDAGSSGAANKVTVQKLLNDTLTNGTYTNAQLSGNLNVAQLSTLGTISSTNGTIATLNSTTGTITTGVIPTLTSITKITSGTGTAAAPAISPTGDTNTGIFFPAADTIALAEGGAESMRIDSSGNVGIGTASPIRRLHAEDSANSIVGRFSSGQTSSWIQFASAIIGTASRIGAPTNDAVASIALMTADIERLRIDSNGNVGIGTTSPATKLTVSGTNGTNSELRVVSTGASTGGRVTLYENTSGCWEFATSGGANSALTVKDLFNNAERFRIASAGQIGIGGANYGTSGQVLTSAGASAAPSWTTITTTPDDGSITPAKLSGGQTGSAPAYAVRSWVCFNGTGTIAIRASGNVSSLTDNGTGLYQINMTQAMPDSDYAVSLSKQNPASANVQDAAVHNSISGTVITVAPTSSAYSIMFNNTQSDCAYVMCSVIR